jgi:proteasome accessory factor C
VIEECADGALVVDFGFAGTDFLVREVLKEAGDAVVLAPADAREAVRAAAETIAAGLAELVGR